MLKIASLLLEKTAIPFDKEEFSFQIQSHPSYPSLHAITGVFDHFQIENVAARVPVTDEVFEQLPKHFIAQINSDEGPQLVLVEKKEPQCILYNAERKKTAKSIPEFLEVFTGIIVAVEKDENLKKQPSENKFTGIITTSLLAVSVLVLFLTSTSNIYSYLSLFISIIGVFISISIVKQELGIKNVIGNAFCSSNDEKKNCDAVLSSKGAILFKNYKLSDLSLIYFTSFSISVVLLSLQNLSLYSIYALSLLSFPITIYSIYYQAFHIKKWCLLCLSIVGVLWLQTAITIYFQDFTFEFNLLEFLTTIVSFLLFFSIWNVIKPRYIEALKNKEIKIDYFKFKRKYSLFSTLLTNNTRVDTKLSAKEIIFGNIDSDLEIVIITNPFCGHCKPVHTIVDDIIHQYQNQVKIIVRFNINSQDIDSKLVKITSSLLEIYSQKGQEECLLAMNEAYNLLSPNDWLEKWENHTIDKSQYIETLQSQKDWCVENKINFTPEILINGYSYPKEYDRKDLTFFIEELSEEYNIEKIRNNKEQEKVS
jgi:uncharacterized membrane protein